MELQLINYIRIFVTQGVKEFLDHIASYHMADYFRSIMGHSAYPCPTCNTTFPSYEMFIHHIRKNTFQKKAA